MVEARVSKSRQNGLDAHPAVRAWGVVRPGHPGPGGVEALKDTSKTGVFRLEGAGPGGVAVIAKRCGRDSGAVERTLYETVFPRLPVVTLRSYGFLEDGPESCWLFLEEAGGEDYSPEKEEHRALAARWLGLMHVAAAVMGPANGLPGLGPDHYRRELGAASAWIRAGRDNLPLGHPDRDALASLLAACAVLDARWGWVERLCDRLPRTLVHGDFVPKNLRVRHGRVGPSLVVFDWEVAGWGLPAADVAECADLTAYAATVRPAWPHLNDRDIGQLAFLGKVFRLVCALSWASESLVSGRTRRGLELLRVYRADLAALLAADGWGG